MGNLLEQKVLKACVLEASLDLEEFNILHPICPLESEGSILSQFLIFSAMLIIYLLSNIINPDDYSSLQFQLLGRLRQEGCKFKACIVFRIGSRPVLALYQEPFTIFFFKLKPCWECSLGLRGRELYLVCMRPQLQPPESSNKLIMTNNSNKMMNLFKPPSYYLAHLIPCMKTSCGVKSSYNFSRWQLSPRKQLLWSDNLVSCC